MSNLVKRSSLFRFPLMGYRATLALPYLLRPARQIARWIVTSREHTNFTYDLTGLNRRYLAHFLAVATGRSVPEILGYFAELENDTDLHAHISRLVETSSYRAVADRQPRFGRRIGWYALVRATAPEVVVETGVDKGLGSCVIAAALLRNRQEGKKGRYYGTDINPTAGYLLRAPYDSAGEILYGDSIESLGKLDCGIDLFINDSDHSSEYEAREYETIKARLTPRAFVVGDNSHSNSKLAEFVEKHGMRFLFFKEEPANHWYPGAGIGLAFR